MLLNPPSLNEIRIELHLYIAVLGGPVTPRTPPPPLDPAHEPVITFLKFHVALGLGKSLMLKQFPANVV